MMKHLFFWVSSREPNLSREVCCLPGAYIWDIRKRLPGMTKPKDYSLLLFFQAESHEATTRKFLNIRKKIYVTWKSAEAIRGTGSVLSPPVCRLQSGQKEENGTVE